MMYELQLYFSHDELYYRETEEEPREKYLKLSCKGEGSLKNIQINLNKIPYSIIRFYLIDNCKILTSTKRCLYVLRNKLKKEEILSLGSAIYKLYNGIEKIDEFPYISEIILKEDQNILSVLPNVVVTSNIFDVIRSISTIGEIFLVENSVLKNTYKGEYE